MDLWKNSRFTNVGQRIEASPESIGLVPLLQKALQESGKPILRIYHEGYSDKAMELYLKIMDDTKIKKISECYYQHSEDYLFASDEAAVSVSNTSSNKSFITISCITTNEKLAASIKEVIATSYTSPAKKGHVFAIIRNEKGSLQISKIGYAGSNLEKGNYLPKVVDDYEYIVNDLRSKDPAGRIAILDGPPGTGKSTMIRGFLMDVPDAIFVVVPPTMVSSIGGPDLLPLLLKTKEDYSRKGATVLILEDAEQCLAPRQFDNISSISSILNLGDGIVGSLFDIRIIATTNCKAKDIDPAITRELRLSKRINIDFLNYEFANGVYKRIMDKDIDLPRDLKEISLAKIYKVARNNGWKPVQYEKQEPAYLLDAGEMLAEPRDIDFDFGR